MAILSGFDQFQGLHWETGSLRNALAYQGFRAPHTDEPFSEALLLGISGGVVMGYFTFNYQGYDPMVRILTRNTFDPLKTIYDRLDIPASVYQTASAEKGVQNLIEVLESGLPAIVSTDMFSLPYNALPCDEGMWVMFPVLVYGFDESVDLVNIADRARVPLTVTSDELARARGRTKKNKYRLLTISEPNPDKLESAVKLGIKDCIRMFFEAPPKGSKNNFGLLAYKKWTDLLVESNRRGSWTKDYPPGRKMYAALTSAFEDIAIFGKEGGADRDVYAQFLDEVSILLGDSTFTDIAKKFKESAYAWNKLATSLLPDEVLQFKEAREMMLTRHKLFLDKGNSALDEIHQINENLEIIKNRVSVDFPLSDSQSAELLDSIRENVQRIHDIELDAFQELSRAIA